MPYDPRWTGRAVELLLRLGVGQVEVSGYHEPDPALVRYRLRGLRLGADGRPSPANRLLAKVSELAQAQAFAEPPPEPVVRLLRDRGEITDEEARLAQHVPVADDLCVEAESAGPGTLAGGLSLFPAVLRLREELAGASPSRVRVGAAGGLGTPEAVAAAFAMGADFVLTGSVNQCTPQAGTSDLVKDLLAGADVEDFATAPSGVGFELGARLPVLRRGVFFPGRADRLFDLYLRHDSVDDLPPAAREQVESRYLGRSMDEVWAEVVASHPDPGQVQRAERDARLRMGLIFRWYLQDTLRRARDGAASDRLNFQVRSGPAVGAFNRVVRGTRLADWRSRNVDDIAWFLMQEAARVLTDQWRRMTGSPADPVPVPA